MMRPRSLFGVGVAAVIALIIGAAWWNYNHTPVQGTVVHRQHSDSYWYYTTTCNPSCTTSHNFMPESWQLCVSGLDRHGRKSEDCVEVGKSSWFAHPEGSEWHR